MKIRLCIRGFVGRTVRFKERIDVEESELDTVVPRLAEKHAAAMASHALHMIEIEFLDEPDPNTRFMRFGTDPSGMVDPHKIDLTGGAE